MLALLSLPLSLPTLSSTQTRQFYVSIQPPVGELMAPVFMSENEFKKEQGECSLGVGVRVRAQQHHWSLLSSSISSCYRSLRSFRQLLVPAGASQRPVQSRRLRGELELAQHAHWGRPPELVLLEAHRK